MQVQACDRCERTQREAGPIERIFLVTGRSSDAAGSMEDEGDNVDLCSRCLVKALEHMLGKRDYAWNTAVLSWVKATRRKPKF